MEEESRGSNGVHLGPSEILEGPLGRPRRCRSVLTSRGASYRPRIRQAMAPWFDDP
ncbi:Hypothetical protein CAP_6108 [Chondromyces apiculatus DSM 436]|uniref:Uncharacterized protein n=1 Tax=Chondromyces apiculatus DSM 436 TaxID=1192034 RepID=A0A017T2D5_9BACT|nr:Hypothetical protein CAP_6108 [Chondromyces apiculatus DSM 436]